VRSLEYLAWITRPDGTMPLIGDDDGGRLLALDERTAHDTRAPLAVGATVFGRGDLAGAAAPPSTELVWLLGPAGLRGFRSLQPTLPSELSRAFPDGGLHVMRSGWDASASMLTIDAGPHGFQNAGHAHADALSLDLTVAGTPMLVDPGTFTYTRFPEWRDRFRETSSHNAATVDGCGSASVAGPFQWGSGATARTEAWHDGGSVVLFAGTHDGFERLRPPVRYRRSLVFIRPALWIVRDETDAEGEHELAIHWQCASGIVAGSTEAGFDLHASNGARLSLRVAGRRGTWSLLDGSVSPTYGVRESAQHLRYTVRGSGGLCVTTVLSGGLPIRTVEPIGVEPASPVVVAWGERRGMLIGRSSMPPWLETDALLTWVDFDVSGPRLVTAAAASRLAVSGTALKPGGDVVTGLSLNVP
jgi:hypothetical protein